uniref:Secreted protein n=1 Tax=Clytia hemisphaerica TaxID=252671 RepID=A0A7M5UY25_9CNID
MHNLFVRVILLLLVVQAAALPVRQTRSNDDGFNRKECGDDDKYHMKRMREFEPKLNTVRKSIGKVALDAAIEGQSRLCNQSALWKVELPVFRAGRSTAESAIQLKIYSVILKTYQDSAIETYRLSKQNSQTQEATTIDEYYGAMWNKLNIDNLKERIDVRLIIQYLDETFLKITSYCGLHRDEVNDDKIKEATSKIVKDIEHGFKRQQNKCKHMKNHLVPILRRQAEDLQLLWDNLIAEVRNRIDLHDREHHS